MMMTISAWVLVVLMVLVAVWTLVISVALWKMIGVIEKLEEVIHGRRDYEGEMGGEN